MTVGELMTEIEECKILQTRLCEITNHPNYFEGFLDESDVARLMNITGKWIELLKQLDVDVSKLV